MTKQDNATKWRLEGDYFDGCNCKSICPCIFELDPTEGYCEGTVAWHIEKGYFIDADNNELRLDNLNAAAVVHAPDNMITGPKWKMGLYLDEKANNERKDALTKIFTGQVGGFFGDFLNHIAEVVGIRLVPIEFISEGKKRRKLRIPSTLELEIEGLTGSDKNKESIVLNPAFSNTPGYDPIIALSSIHTYRDYGMEWDSSGRNAFYSRFRYES
jgi:hypothetical protein